MVRGCSLWHTPVSKPVKQVHVSMHMLMEVLQLCELQPSQDSSLFDCPLHMQCLGLALLLAITVAARRDQRF